MCILIAMYKAVTYKRRINNKKSLKKFNINVSCHYFVI